MADNTTVPTIAPTQPVEGIVFLICFMIIFGIPVVIGIVYFVVTVIEQIMDGIIQCYTLIKSCNVTI
jgi:hypothetical protein